MNPTLLDFVEWLELKGVDITDGDEFRQWHCSKDLPDTEEDCSDEEPEAVPVAETIIVNFFEKCLLEDRLPSLEETQTVAILDGILSKYN